MRAAWKDASDGTFDVAVDRAVHTVNDLPRIAGDLPGIGGRIKDLPEHFVVQEVALYEPSGVGEHVYLRHRRSGTTTRALVDRLARACGVAAREIGYAGMKDRVAVAEQTFSVPFRGDENELAARVRDQVEGELVWVRRHTNKLKRGHLLGNRFEIVVTALDDATTASERAQAIRAALDERGLPNFYGAQRLGDDGRNAREGFRVLFERKNDWLTNLKRTAWQAQAFNEWLVDRMQRGELARVAVGDVAKKLDNGALFDVTDADVDTARVERREITPSGPLYGSDMRRAGGEPGDREVELLARFGLVFEDLQRSRLLGSRRAARIWPKGLVARPHADGLCLSFELSKGAYATHLVREFTGAPPDATLQEAQVDDG